MIDRTDAGNRGTNEPNAMVASNHRDGGVGGHRTHAERQVGPVSMRKTFEPNTGTAPLLISEGLGCAGPGPRH